jgi:hypothetical protein
MKERGRSGRGPRGSSPYARIARLIAQTRERDREDLFAPAEETDLEALEQLGIPETVLEFYREHAPVEALDFEDVRLWDAPHILEENRDYHPGSEAHELGYVVVAGNGSGDLYCLDLGEWRSEETPRVVLVPHDVEVGARDRALVERQTLPVAESFDEFLLLLARGGLSG